MRLAFVTAFGNCRAQTGFYCEVTYLIGYIDVGGGIRAVYGTAVLDFCLDNGVDFPYLIGVSAGSGNIASYLSHQKERSLRFYTEFSMRKEYMSLNNLIKTGSYIDLDYIYSGLSNDGGESPLDFDAMVKNPAEFTVVSTNALTGEAEYFNKDCIARNEFDVFKTSCCIPIINKAYIYRGKPYYDGGLSDPVPVRKAFLDGCDKVVVCLTRPQDFRKKHRLPQNLFNAAIKKYPQIAKTLYTSVEKYNEDIDYILRLQDEGRVLVIAPKDCCGVDTLTKNRKNIEALYSLGYKDAEKIIDFINK